MSPYFSWPGYEFQNRNNFLFDPQFSCAARDLLKTCKPAKPPVCHIQLSFVPFNKAMFNHPFVLHLGPCMDSDTIQFDFARIIIIGNLAKVCRSVNINGKPLSDTKMNTIFGLVW